MMIREWVDEKCGVARANDGYRRVFFPSGLQANLVMSNGYLTLWVDGFSCV